MTSQFAKPVLKTKHQRFILPTLLFIILFLYLGILQSSPTMLDPDGFYHAKMAELTWENGFISSFPWLPETTLATNWTDQHFLYHLLLAPLSAVIDPLWAVKIGAVILGALFGLTFFIVLSNFIRNKRAAFWWTILMFTSGALMFRLTLVKAQPLALILFILLLWSFIKKRIFLFSVLMFLYVLAHGSFIIIPGLIGWSIVFSIFFVEEKKKAVLSSLLFLCLAAVSIIASLAVQPTFPDNMVFYWHQIFRIALFKVDGLDITGLEWGILTPWGLTKALSQLILFIGFTIFLLIKYKKSITRTTWLLLWFLVPLTFLTLRSMRNFEFFLPALILCIASTFKDARTRLLESQLWLTIRMTTSRHALILLFIPILFLTWFLYPMVSIFVNQTKAKPLTFMQEQAVFLSRVTQKGELIVNTYWDMFPALFYYNTHNTYLTGLDPAFLQLKRPEVYRALVEMRKGNFSATSKLLPGGQRDAYIIFYNYDKDNKDIVAESKRYDTITHILTTDEFHLFRFTDK